MQATTDNLDHLRPHGRQPRELTLGADRRPLVERLGSAERALGYHRGERGYRSKGYDCTAWFAEQSLTTYATILTDIALDEPTRPALDEIVASFRAAWIAGWQNRQPDVPDISDIAGDLVALRALGATYLPTHLAAYWSARMSMLAANWECDLAPDPGPAGNAAIVVASYRGLPEPTQHAPLPNPPAPSGDATDQVRSLNVDRWRATGGPLAVVVPPTREWPDGTTATDRARAVAQHDWHGDAGVRHFANVTLPELVGQLRCQCAINHVAPRVINVVAEALDDAWNAAVRPLNDPTVERRIVGELAALRALGEIYILPHYVPHWVRLVERLAVCYGEQLAPDPGPAANAAIVAERYLFLDA